MAKSRRKVVFILSFGFILVVAIGLAFTSLAIRGEVREQFGRPSPTLSLIQRVLFPMELYINRNDLTSAPNLSGEDQTFIIESGESVSMICLRLENVGLIHDAELMRTYLVYSGLDRNLQAGQFQLSSSMSPLQIASALLDATPSEAIVSILSGWRIEEIAENVIGSGLSISREEFVNTAYNPANDWVSMLPVDEIISLEGFFFPGTYVFPREAGLPEVFSEVLETFSNQMDQTLIDGFSRQGLTIYEGVKLASIVEKEAVVDEEKPMIASVFYNRLAAGMRLETDPTVQYALGYQEATGTWWKAPLSTSDLGVDSPYNTYLNVGLPPTPICNPGLASLRAVAFPAMTPYFYFRADCDGSGQHLFAITYEEHLNNACE